MQFRTECDLNKKGCDSWINHAAESQSDRKDHQWFQNGCNKGLYHCLTLFIVYKIIVTVNCPASIIVFSTVWLTLYLCVQQYSCCAIGSRDRSLSVWVSWYDDHLGISSLLSLYTAGSFISNNVSERHTSTVSGLFLQSWGMILIRFRGESSLWEKRHLGIYF